MHVGLNLVFLVPGETGGRETYARELVSALLAERPDLRLTAFVNREFTNAGERPWGERIRQVTVPVNARSRAAWAFGEQMLLPRLAVRADVDVLHSLANTAPAHGRFASVVTIHDLLYHRHPELLSRASLLGTRLLLPRGARRADRVITVSAASRDDVVSVLKIPSDRIDVVPNGLGTPPPMQAPDRLIARADIGADGRFVVLCVASALPHKRLETAVAAIAAIPEPARPLLLLAGHGTDRDRSPDVRGLGVVSAQELELLYAAADCVVVPSLFEGFGMPVLEAMARGLPVVASDVPALREVGSDRAVLVRPDDPVALAEAIARLRDDGHERRRLAEAGPDHAARFTWTAAARATGATYDTAAGGRGPRRPLTASR